MTSNLFRCVIVLLILLTANTSFGQEGEADDFYKKGAQAYFSGDYTSAIINFKRAQEISPNPMFLYNLSLSYGKLGNYDEALAYAERAEAGNLPDAVRHKSSSRIAGFGVRSSAEAMIDDINASPTCTADSCGADEVCNTDTGTCEAADPQLEEPAPSTPLLGLKGWTGAGLLAVSAGLFVGAIVINGQAADLKDEWTGLPAGDEKDQVKEDFDSTASTGQLLFFSGVGAAVVGAGLLTWDILDNDSDEAQATQVAPLLGADLVGVSLQGVF